MPPGLAHTHHCDAGEIGLRNVRQRGEGRLHIIEGFGIGHVITGVAPVQRVLIRVLEEIIGGDADIALARMAPRQIHRMGHEPVALMQQDDDWNFAGHIGRCDEGGQTPGASGRPGYDFSHSTSPLGPPAD